MYVCNNSLLNEFILRCRFTMQKLKGRQVAHAVACNKQYFSFTRKKKYKNTYYSCHNNSNKVSIADATGYAVTCNALS